MPDGLDYLVSAIQAIRDDKRLVEAFKKILTADPEVVKDRALALHNELEKLNAPEQVTNLVRLLANERIAQQVLNAISKG